MSADKIPCPYPCGWENLQQLIYQRAAYFARATLDDSIPEAIRTTGIDLGQYAIQLLRTARNIPEGYSLIHLDSVLVPRGQAMPQTIEAWQYLGHQYEQELLTRQAEISSLKGRNNDLQQELVRVKQELSQLKQESQVDGS